MSDLTMLQGTWLGSQGVQVAPEAQPLPKSSRIAYIPKRKAWQLPISREPERAPQIIRGGGEIVLPLPILSGSGRVTTVSRSGGAVMVRTARLRATGVALARAGGCALVDVPNLSGTAVIDEPDHELAALLGIEDLEDFR